MISTKTSTTRALITSDIHLSENSRDEYRIKFLRTFRDMCRKHKADTVVILGDLTESKDRHPAWLVNQVVDHIYKLAGICKDVIILRGNHDYLEPENPFYRFVQRIDGVTWINTPTDDKLAQTAVLKGFGACLWLPHTTNYKRDWANLDLNRYDRIFCHQTFSGVTIGGGRTMDGIPLDILPQTEPDQVISGDIHVPQQLGPVTYVGSPYTVDFGDYFEPRILLMEDDQLKSIPCPGPQKRLVEAKSPEEFWRKCQKFEAGDIIKARIATKHIDKWPETKATIKKWCEDHGYVPYTIQPVLDQAKRMIASKEISETRSDEQILRDYAKSRGVNEQILKTGLSLLREV